MDRTGGSGVATAAAQAVGTVAAGRASPGPAVLLLTDDPWLVDEIERAAATSGVQVIRQTSAEPGSRPDGVLVVGLDQAPALIRRGPARSGPVILVARDGEPGHADQVYRLGVDLRADHVALLPGGRDWLAELLSRAVEPARRGRVVAVHGGCGGAGASVLATGFGLSAAAAGASVALVDLDPRGGGLDLALALDDVPGLRWPDVLAARGRLPASSVQASLPRAGTLGLLSWGSGGPVDVPVAAVDAVLDAAARGHELVVIDLPRGGDPLVDCALRRVDAVFVVVPTRLRAISAAAQLVPCLGPVVDRASVVVRRLPGERWSAGSVADAVGLPLAATMRDEPKLDAAISRGELRGLGGRGPLFRAAEQCLGSLAAR
jgi:secretion/DNA translocation related CpaE-like protein